jgi:hypothetical protein
MTCLLLLQLLQACFTALHSMLYCFTAALYFRDPLGYLLLLQLLQTGRPNVAAVANMYTTGVCIIFFAIHGNVVRKD